MFNSVDTIDLKWNEEKTLEQKLSGRKSRFSFDSEKASELGDDMRQHFEEMASLFRDHLVEKYVPEVDRKYEAHRKNRQKNSSKNSSKNSQGITLVHSPLAFSIREVNTNSQYWVGEKRDV